jgi:hypothetical protein
MKSIKHFLRAASLVGGSLLIALWLPLSVLAEEVPAATTDSPTTSAPTDSTASSDPAPAVTTEPAAAVTATDPEVTPESAEPEVTYTKDEASGLWNSNLWTYDTVSGTYKPTPAPVVVQPADPEAAVTGEMSLDASTTAAIANALASIAATGDASVIGNTAAGGATTGDASSVATIINNVNSSLAADANQQTAQFVSNIMGDVNGDIMLQPMLLKAMLEAGSQISQPSLNLNASTDNAISNDLDLSATSGDATVASNTLAGNATSGSANTVANVVNLVNSMIAANQSFVGTINIYGNLNGDILIAPDFIPQLLASNGGSMNNAQAVGTASITSDNNTSVVNNIALAANTGQALVDSNTSAGSATSGDALTNTVIFNLTNHEVVASNSLLIFVNVLGKWVGVIVDAPVGATAAAIGDNVTKNDIAPNLVIESNNAAAITNNIKLASNSGNASVTNNTVAGNALTGDATASANVANIVGSQMGLSGWFGVLFINVFGSWVGSVGLNTSAGDPIFGTPSPIAGLNAEQPVTVMQFIPKSAKQAPVATVIQYGIVAPLDDNIDVTEEVYTAAAVGSNAGTSGTVSQGGVAPIGALNFPALIGSLALIGGSLYSLRRTSKAA